MRWTKHFIWLVWFGFGASIPSSTDLGPGDALVLTFAAVSAALGTVAFLLLRTKDTEEVCQLHLPPGPPAAWTLSEAA